MPLPEPGAMVNLHATAIALGGQAVLIRGRSGAGKSDLALRVITISPGLLVPHQPMLVADDRVIAQSSSTGVIVRPPAALEGLIEVRGVGIVRVPFLAVAELALVADLVEPTAIERLPEPLAPVEICGHSVPRIRLAPFEASAAIKLLLALKGAIPTASEPTAGDTTAGEG